MVQLLTCALVGLVVLMSVTTLIDCVRTPSDQFRFVPKLLWLLFLFHAPVFGGLVWLYLGKRSPNATRGPIHRIEPLVKSGSGGI
ncbi:PLD nuclease N-terminal domain-containing protein [Streptomyces sp. NPDC002888]|uniref:PLD nuclease N-terminal domain-containing protein n=1 Tax=Streptomyces sp. NPDC002888 TaxID=3364668 RepID=UPI0036C2557E